MAKKTRTESNREDEESSKSTSVIKLRLTPEQAKRVRVAAALESKQPGAFARDAALEVAERVIAKGL
jgi:uncharacterized protein (DUF1778 family)